MERQQIWQTSSQSRHWMFTADQLEKIRNAVNSEGVQRCKAAVSKEKALQLVAHGSNLEDANSAGEEFTSKIDWVTTQEQQDYVLFFETKVADYGRAFGLDLNVQAAAVIFLKRYYLFHSVMDDDPKIMTLTAIFLATKTENSNIMSLDNFLAKVPNRPSREVILEHELRLCEGLRFEFSVHHIHWSLHGFYLDMQAQLKASGSKNSQSLKSLVETYTRALKFVGAAIHSDLVFTHWPSQIALASFLAAAKEPNSDKRTYEDEIEKYLTSVLRNDPRFDDLRERKLAPAEVVIQEHVNLLGTGALQDKTKGAAIRGKLQICQNPERDPNSLVFMQLKRQQEEERQAKRQKKYKRDG
ncbi:cyclin-like protein [Cladochytrium replicatum]|nr:cyclin-like protein [Cladochytrium replicatum]